jgi:hypothetical protein
MKLTEFVGKHVTLVEKPDGCTSQHYPVVVGNQYLVLGVGGCCFEIDIPGYGVGLINHERFSELKKPATV